MIEICDAMSIPMEMLGEEMTRCFEDYVIPIAFPPALISWMIRMDAIDLLNTRLAYEGDEMVGVLLVCRRGRLVRVGVMAVAKPYRRTGVGKMLMERAKQDALARGDRQMVLEAIETNIDALAFYEASGFKTVFRLLGFTYKLAQKAGGANLTEIDFSTMASLLLGSPSQLCSWETAPATISNLAWPTQAFTKDGVAMAVSPHKEDGLICRGIALSGTQDDAKLRDLVAGLGEIFPGRILRLPPFFPEPCFKAPLLAAGFIEESLAQVQMELVLSEEGQN